MAGGSTLPEKEVDLERSEIERRENTNLRILEWMHDLQTDEKETQSIQQVDIIAGKHEKGRNSLFGWTATDRPLDVPPDNLSPVPSTGTSITIFVRGVGVGFTHTKILIIKKLREIREVNGLKLNHEEVEPTIGRNFKAKFEISNEYFENILLTDSDFILSDRTSAISITEDMRLNTRLEADFKRESTRMWSFCSGRGQNWEVWRHFLLQFHSFLAKTYAFGDKSQ